MAKRAQVISTADTALDLADRAERGDTHAAYQLTQLMGPGSVTELIEFIAPSLQITTVGFDAVADGFFLAGFVEQRKASR